MKIIHHLKDLRLIFLMVQSDRKKLKMCCSNIGFKLITWFKMFIFIMVFFNVCLWWNTVSKRLKLQTWDWSSFVVKRKIFIYLIWFIYFYWSMIDYLHWMLWEFLQDSFFVILVPSRFCHISWIIFYSCYVVIGALSFFYWRT